MAGSWRCSPWRWPAWPIPKRARGGVTARRRHRAVAGDRPGDAALPRGGRRGDRRCSGSATASEARRLAAYGVSLGGGCALGFLVFASYANRAPVCDALSPVWLSAMVVAGAIAVGAGLAEPDRLAWLRLGAAAAGRRRARRAPSRWSGPHCLGRLERCRPSSTGSGSSKVREAMPVWRHGAHDRRRDRDSAGRRADRLRADALAHRREPDRLVALGWRSRCRPLLAALLLLWQTRAGPAAQLLSIPGATALGLGADRLVPGAGSGCWCACSAWSRAFLIVSGARDRLRRRGWFPTKPANDRRGRRSTSPTAAARTLGALRPVALQPRGQVLTFVDLGPAADHGDPSQRHRRPLSPQRAGRSST